MRPPRDATDFAGLPVVTALRELPARAREALVLTYYLDLPEQQAAALAGVSLAALRRRGILEYGTLGQILSTEFHEKWIRHRAGHEAEFLQAPESSALNNFGLSYERIKQLKPFPADSGSLYALAASVAIPALPVVLAQIPVAVVLADLFKALR